MFFEKRGDIDSSSLYFIIIGSILIILLTVIFFWFLWYKRKDRKILTIQNISLFGVFLALTVGLSFLSIPTPVPGVSIGFDLIPIMFIGFLLGPLEGLIFGAIADLIISLTHGYAWLFLYSLVKPLTGLIGGIFGYYKNPLKNKSIVTMNLKNDKTFKLNIMTVLTQLFMLLLFATSLVLLNLSGISGQSPYWGGVQSFSDSEIIVLNVSISVIFLLSEVLYWFAYWKISEDNINLLNIALSIVICQTIINSFLINSISADIYYGVPYYISVIARCYTNPMLIPIETAILYALINGSKYAVSQMSNPLDKW